MLIEEKSVIWVRIIILVFEFVEVDFFCHLFILDEKYRVLTIL